MVPSQNLLMVRVSINRSVLVKICFGAEGDLSQSEYRLQIILWTLFENPAPALIHQGLNVKHWLTGMKTFMGPVGQE